MPQRHNFRIIGAALYFSPHTKIVGMGKKRFFFFLEKGWGVGRRRMVISNINNLACASRGDNFESCDIGDDDLDFVLMVIIIIKMMITMVTILLTFL